MDLVNDWKNSLLKLKDDPFFELVKNYLGPVQTPYHKPSIINSLEKLLLKSETRERLFSMLDEEELKICGSVLKSGGIEINNLRKLFEHQYTVLKFRSVIENLVERFILYCDSTGLLKLNPLLADTINSLISPPPVDTLHNKLEVPEPWLNEDLLTAFLSIVNEVPAIYRQDGSVKKRVLDIFRERLTDSVTVEQIQLLSDLASVLHLIEDSGEFFNLNCTAIETFFSMAPEQRCRVLFAGTAALPWKNTDTKSAYTAGKRIADSLFSLMRKNMAYHRESLTARLSFAESPDDFPFTRKILVEHALDNLLFTGFLSGASGIEQENNFIAMGLYTNHLFRGLDKLKEILLESTTVKAKNNSRTPLLQPTFEALLPPDSSGKSKAFTACFLKLKRYDRLSHYELDEDLFIRSVRNANRSKTILDELKDFTGGALPQNVLMTASGWLNAINQIEISTGTVVKVSPEMIPLIEDEFASSILEILAPGVYFIKPERLSPFLLKWRNLGFADPGEIRNHLSVNRIKKTIDFNQPVEHLTIETRDPDEEKITSEEISGFEVSRESMNLELEARLLKLNLTADQTRELQAKIERKIILFPDQIREDICRIGRIEARGIDFHAKLRIIEDVLNTDQDLLEIETPELEESPVLVHPLSLEKNPGNPQMTALILPEEKEYTFKVRRVVRIRKRKRSLFY